MEDEGSILASVGRFYRHFHDPLKPWDAAGLTFPGLGENESSVRWMQNRRQTLTGAAGGNWSWHDARRMYYQALTEADAERRDALMAATFRALGQIMHLVVDASNPDHSRNDPHPLPSVPILGRLFWNYDKAVESRHGRAGSAEEQAFVRRFLSNPIGFDRAILGVAAPAGEPVATVPIARLIDADVYTGANPAVTFSAAAPTAPVAVGIAEVSNANFFSENTLGGEYPNPPTGTAGLIRTELELPRRSPGGLNLVRRYYSRPEGQGLLPANPLFAECAGARNPRAATALYPCLDDVVFDQVAAHMLPRAVGYARGVLEYFFRGRLRVLGVGVAEDGGLFIDIENASDEPMDGVFELHARHRPGTATERRERAAELNSGRALTLGPGGDERFPLTLSAAEPTPSFILVFRGALGQEEGAVAGQVFTVPLFRIEQVSYDAEMRPTCAAFSSPPPASEAAPVFEGLGCEWRPVSHRFEVRLVPEVLASVDPSIVPPVQRIEAVWDGSVPGPATLIVDGRAYPDGVWSRGGEEEVPISFSLTDPTDRRDGRLMVTVTLQNGRVLSTQMATFKPPSSDVTKSVYSLYGDPTKPPVSWLYREYRTWWLEPDIDHDAFVVASLGGYPVPMGITFGGEQLLASPELWRTAQMTFEPGMAFAVGMDTVLVFSTKAEALARMAEGVLVVRLPAPPELDWRAVVTPKPSAAADAALWEAFVGAQAPEYQILLRAHAAAD